VAGATNGIELLGSDNEIHNRGTIVGGQAGVHAVGGTSGVNIVNRGVIQGTNTFAVRTEGEVTLFNTGELNGAVSAVRASGASTIVNIGKIVGGSRYAIEAITSSPVIVVNDGRIEGGLEGGISFWDGNDLYKGRLGEVTGKLFFHGGNDIAYGGTRSESFVGGAGDDSIDGGGGNDIAFYSGSKADYTVSTSGGVTTVHDERLNGDGTDTLTNVRFLQFSDQTVILHNAAPTAVTLSAGSIAETAGVNSAVAALSSTDADGDAVTYSLVGSANGTFRLENNSLVLARALDFETQARQHTVTVEASDKYGGRIVQAFTLAVANVVETHPLTLTGTAAVDGLLGEAGADRLLGKGGRDVLTGGQGKDAFVFDTRPNARTNKDTITDFSRADDTIHLAKNVFSKIAKKGVLEKKAFYVGTKAHDADDRIVYNKKTGALYYDADGNGAKAAVHFATLANKVSINERDFFVI
jgi:Ca2+-binding RTX toxin-like protein